MLDITIPFRIHESMGLVRYLFTHIYHKDQPFM